MVDLCSAKWQKRSQFNLREEAPHKRFMIFVYGQLTVITRPLCQQLIIVIRVIRQNVTALHVQRIPDISAVFIQKLRFLTHSMEVKGK